jgi:hypothetical protein
MAVSSYSPLRNISAEPAIGTQPKSPGLARESPVLTRSLRSMYVTAPTDGVTATQVQQYARV